MLYYKRDQQGRLWEITGDEILAEAERIRAERAKPSAVCRETEPSTLYPWQMPSSSHTHTISPIRNCRKGGCSHVHCYYCPLR